MRAQVTMVKDDQEMQCNTDQVAAFTKHGWKTKGGKDAEEKGVQGKTEAKAEVKEEKPKLKSKKKEAED